MGFLGIGDTDRMLVDIPVQYAPQVGLPYDPDDPSAYAKSGRKINIKVSKGKGEAKAKDDAARELLKYGIPWQTAKSLVSKGSEILTEEDPRRELLQLERYSPEDIAEARGRTDMPTGAGVPSFRGKTWSIGDQTIMGGLGQEKYFGDRAGGPSQEEGLGLGAITGDAGDTFGMRQRAEDIAQAGKGTGWGSRAGPGTGVYGESITDALAAMRAEEEKAQAEIEKQILEFKLQEERDQATKAYEDAMAEEERKAKTRDQLEVELEAQRQAAREEEDKAREDKFRRRAEEEEADPQKQDLTPPSASALAAARTAAARTAAERTAAAGTAAAGTAVPAGPPGPFTPFEDATGIQEMLNIFMQDPERYFTTETIYGDDGLAVGTQQVLNPAASAALQAFSTQRGAEAMETGARFGTGTPFGAIAGLGGTAQDATGLAEQQAYAGITSPFAALQTDADIGDISQILRGGVTAEEQRQLAGLQARGGVTAAEQRQLAGLQARGGLSAEEQRQLAGLQARGGLSAEDQFALSGMQARGGLTPDQMRGLAGLQARGGLTPQERYAEQRLGMLPSLLQMSPQSLGGFAEVFGGGPEGKQALQGYLSPFFQQPDFAGQGAAPAINWGAQQALTRPAPAVSTAPSFGTGTPSTWQGDEAEGAFSGWDGQQALPRAGVSEAVGFQPFKGQYLGGVGQGAYNPDIRASVGTSPASMGGASVQNLMATTRPAPVPQTRQTVGGYQKATPFARGGVEAKAAIAGKDLEDYLGEVTPFGGVTRRGGFGSRVGDRFTY